MPSVRYLLMRRSTSTCLCIVVASTIAPVTRRFFASSTNDATTGACDDVGRVAAQLVEVARATRR